MYLVPPLKFASPPPPPAFFSLRCCPSLSLRFRRRKGGGGKVPPSPPPPPPPLPFSPLFTYLLPHASTSQNPPLPTLSPSSLSPLPPWFNASALSATDPGECLLSRHQSLSLSAQSYTRGSDPVTHDTSRHVRIYHICIPCSNSIIYPWSTLLFKNGLLKLLGGLL